MSVVDSFELLLNQIAGDIKSFQATFTNALILVGAWYTLRISIRVGTFAVECLKCCRKSNFVKRYGRWAVVTGCTQGIGEAFVHRLASKGLNIVLISRNRSKLETQARFIENLYGVHTAIVVSDFTKFDERDVKLLKKTLISLEIGILVNNVGMHYDYPMPFYEVSEEHIQAMVDVNIRSMVSLTHAVLPGMVERKQGLIVNMSSSAPLLPTPLISLYSATKEFLDHFSNSLYFELAPHGIHVQSLVPMYIATDMTAYSPTLQMMSIFTPTAETYVKHAVKTFGCYRQNCGYFPHTLQRLLMLLPPNFISIQIGYWMHRHLQQEGKTHFKKSD